MRPLPEPNGTGTMSVPTRTLREIVRGLPDEVPVVVRDHHQNMITLGQFRKVINGLPDEVPVEVAIRDHWHFNQLLGDLPVTGVAVTQGPTSPVVVLNVPGVS